MRGSRASRYLLAVLVLAAIPATLRAWPRPLPTGARPVPGFLEQAFGRPAPVPVSAPSNPFSTLEAPDPESAPSAPSSRRKLFAGAKLDTRYPVVLAHGILGFRNLGLGQVTLGSYFRGVIQHLRKKGLRVGITYVGKTNGVEERAARLKAGIDHMFPGEKVNIIAHSMGGLDARHMITHLGMSSRVVSLTTVGTPHRGSYVADWALSRIGRDLGLHKLLLALGINVDAATHLTTAWCREFNRVTPDVAGIRYFSYGGHQRWLLVSPPLMPFSWYIRLCERRIAGQIEGAAVRLMLQTRSWGRQIVQSFARQPASEPTIASPAVAARYDGRSDGLVPLSSAPWGESFDVIPMDHIDQIGWLTIQDAPALYEHIVRRLITEGF